MNDPRVSRHSPCIHTFELDCYPCRRKCLTGIDPMPNDWTGNLSEWEVQCANGLRRRAVCKRCRKPMDVTPRWTNVVGRSANAELVKNGIQ